MNTIHLTISDETLRDGEQQVGLCFSAEMKRSLAHRIAATGVHQIALMPAVHETEADLVRLLAAEGLADRLAASTPMTYSAIDQSKTCGVEQIILFHAVSDRLLFLRDPEINRHPVYKGTAYGEFVPTALRDRIRRRMIAKVSDHLRYAADLGLRICFAAEDASRADFEFLAECLTTFSPYLEQFLLCDTVGILTPEKTYAWVHDLLPYAPETCLSVHFHNDMGLALENTIQAVRAGATGISGTFGGIGERAGNVALEQALNGLRLRFGWEVAGIHYGAMAQVAEDLHRQGICAHPPYSPQAQHHETGIHVHSLLRDRHSYTSLPHSLPQIWFGKHSGVSNFRYLFEQYLQTSLTPEQYKQLSTAMKAIAIRENRSYSLEEVLVMLEQGILTCGESHHQVIIPFKVQPDVG
ncbi:2-isopropylmalate synthase [Leptolyngbya ohadii]|uniref:2-isopropylmalate synthase n=1 Tax=Leptolyngbya ohadii TaxID=1962290 RepID=UPI000B5A14B5|nr:2-isopropylmalate synthase [Leptolyngbya ohadii]